MKTFKQLRKEEREKRITSAINHEGLSKKQKETITKYIDHQRALGQSIETIQAYAWRLSKFAREVKKPFEKVTKDDFTKFLAKLQKEGKAVSYINGYKIPLRVFYKWFLDIKDDDLLLSDLKPSRKVNMKTRSDALEKDEIKKLIESAETFRDRFILSALYETAMRKSEFLSLRIKDIKVNGGFAEITSVNGKTGYRKMSIPLVMSYPDLLNHLNNHPNKEDPNSPLIYTMYNASAVNPDKGMGVYGLNDFLRKYQKKSGLKKKVYPHIMRHSRLTHLADDGWNEMDLRVFAGWTASSSMAERYIHTSGKRVQDRILKEQGIKEDEETKQVDKSLDPRPCARCKHVNSPVNNFCESCGMVLDLKVAVKVAEEREKSGSVAMKAFQKNPQLREVFKETIREMLKNGELQL